MYLMSHTREPRPSAGDNQLWDIRGGPNILYPCTFTRGPHGVFRNLHISSLTNNLLNRNRIKTSINKRAVQAKVMKLRDAQVECQRQDKARWRKVCSDLQ